MDLHRYMVSWVLLTSFLMERPLDLLQTYSTEHHLNLQVLIQQEHYLMDLHHFMVSWVVLTSFLMERPLDLLQTYSTEHHLNLQVLIQQGHYGILQLLYLAIIHFLM